MELAFAVCGLIFGLLGFGAGGAALVILLLQRQAPKKSASIVPIDAPRPTPKKKAPAESFASPWAVAGEGEEQEETTYEDLYPGIGND